MRHHSPGINFKKAYQLGEDYQSIKGRATGVLGHYLDEQDLIAFNKPTRTVTFSTERLIPPASTRRPRVMLLFSNPHPHSVQQGMFLSPNTKRRENSFWPIMEDAGWLPIPKENRNPEQLADICLKANYEEPFELLFYCYYAFPTNYPEEIRKVFGGPYFSQYIEPEAKKEFRDTVQDTSMQAVVTFNKDIFNLVSRKQVERYINDLKEGQLIQSQINAIDKDIPIFLSFPTGWHYHKDYKQLRKDSLERIQFAIENPQSRRYGNIVTNQ
jgi:hypothetical protein